MIKPVYFGNKGLDKKRLDYVNKIKNFSDWVKNKIDEEMGLVNTKNIDIENIIRKILKEEIVRDDNNSLMVIEQKTEKEENIMDGWIL